jgi:hypothetical protein
MAPYSDPSKLTLWLARGYNEADVLAFLNATQIISQHPNALLDLRMPNQRNIKTALDDAARLASTMFWAGDYPSEDCWVWRTCTKSTTALHLLIASLLQSSLASQQTDCSPVTHCTGVGRNLQHMLANATQQWSGGAQLFKHVYWEGIGLTPPAMAPVNVQSETNASGKTAASSPALITVLGSMCIAALHTPHL